MDVNFENPISISTSNQISNLELELIKHTNKTKDWVNKEIASLKQEHKRREAKITADYQKKVQTLVHHYRSIIEANTREIENLRQMLTESSHENKELKDKLAAYSKEKVQKEFASALKKVKETHTEREKTLMNEIVTLKSQFEEWRGRFEYEQKNHMDRFNDEKNIMAQSKLESVLEQLKAVNRN